MEPMSAEDWTVEDFTEDDMAPAGEGKIGQKGDCKGRDDDEYAPPEE